MIFQKTGSGTPAERSGGARDRRVRGRRVADCGGVVAFGRCRELLRGQVELCGKRIFRCSSCFVLRRRFASVLLRWLKVRMFAFESTKFHRNGLAVIIKHRKGEL